MQPKTFEKTINDGSMRLCSSKLNELIDRQTSEVAKFLKFKIVLNAMIGTFKFVVQCWYGVVGKLLT